MATSRRASTTTARLIPQLLSPIDRRAYPNNVIPSSEMYAPGLAVLNRYPLPNRTQTPTTNYNYEIQPPQVENLTQQPAIRIDYQLSSKLRLNGKYSGQRARPITRPGLIPGFTDVNTPYPYITNYAFTVNYTLSPTTFVEATYGFIRNELAGGNENGVLINDSSNRLNQLAAFPLIYPNAGKVNNDGYYANEVLDDVAPPCGGMRQNRMMNLPPIFNWGGRIGAAPPNQRYPGLAEHQPHAGRGGQHHQGHGPSHAEGRVLQQPQLQGAERRRRRRPQLPGHG